MVYNISPGMVQGPDHIWFINLFINQSRYGSQIILVWFINQSRHGPYPLFCMVHESVQVWFINGSLNSSGMVNKLVLV